MKNNEKKRAHDEYQNPSLIPTTGMRLTLFILMNYPIHIDTISKELSILYFKGSRSKFL